MSFLISEETSILKLNFDILETNLINIGLLIALLVYVKISSLDPNLKARQKEILANLEMKQNDLLQAFQYYSYCNKSFQNTLLCLSNLDAFYLAQKQNAIASQFNIANDIMDTNFLTTKNLILSSQRKSFLSLQKNINYFVASRILRKFFLLNSTEQSKLLKNTISKLTKINT